MTRPAGPAASTSSFRDQFDRPVFIVSTPRSGSTLLFETLAQAPGLHTVGGESHWLIEDITAFSPAARGWGSNRLTAADATPEPVEQLAQAFYTELRDRDGVRAEGRVRMLEKTPKNALRVPFFDAAWPDALFVYLYRDVRETLSSMIEAWLSGAFRTYPRLPGWTGHPWSLLLVPGWQRLIGRPLPEVVAEQWAITSETLLGDLAALPRERLRAVDYGEFLASPQPIADALAQSLDLKWDRRLGPLPLSKTTVSKPRAGKWRSIEPVIEAVLPIVEKADSRARAFVEELTSPAT
ncbi:sulfotransferase [Sphingomonas sp.]|uniref:sulfotransferase family protein n=1 Tax=Sphingomonas sp. TaxID=28214 RepID=UPI0017E89EC8|nr:sulfotransferase [Sphingomonas sp.]MBA3511725.1 sulfotransferase [Sphingomonas sp.]